MQTQYRNKGLEKNLIGVNAVAAAMVAGTFIMLFGFREPLLPENILYVAQIVLFFIFTAEKIVRRFNVVSKKDFWRENWIELPLLFVLAMVMVQAGRWVGKADAESARHLAVGIYLVLEIVIKVCRTTVRLAASGKNPTRTLIISFVVLILAGAGLLMLPKSAADKNVGFVDALFTSTSAACVTGLTAKETGGDFSFMGQVIILSLIQLGGLGIVIFGAVFALLLGQALNVRESVAMQDLLSAQTLGRIGNMIAFVFGGTILFEAAGAIAMFNMWNSVPGRVMDLNQQWFCTIFHSISAFCNAGFGLFSDNLAGYNRNWGVYAVICPLIVIGGLGFAVLYNLGGIAADRVNRFFKKLFKKHYLFSTQMPKRMYLQTKIVLLVTTGLIVFGTLGILLFEHFAGGGNSGIGTGKNCGILDALFQSITARTAGFNTVDIGALSSSSKFVLILLMFIGGSPGGTAGGIKTVTLAVVIMAALATLRKRDEVEVFNRSIRLLIVRRAITVTLLFIVVLFTAALALSITENKNQFTMMQIMFETASALGTVGLSTGITGSLTSAGKLIIIMVMLIGRLGPLTLLASLTFNLKPARYEYPEEPVIVG
jgi:trk system potassium uptake protein TrkH